MRKTMSKKIRKFCIHAYVKSPNQTFQNFYRRVKRNLIRNRGLNDGRI